MTQLSLGIAIIGFGCGMAVAARVAPHDRNAPATAGIIGAVLFYLAAEILITAVMLGLWGLTIYFAIRAWPTVHESFVTFARESGMRVLTARPQLSIADRIAAMHRDFESRADSIRSLRLKPEDEEDCIEMAHVTLRDATQRLAGSEYQSET